MQGQWINQASCYRCRIHETIDLMMAAQDSGSDDIAAEAARAKIADANQRMGRYTGRHRRRR